MNVAVFGASGFVGAHVCQALERRGHAVHAIRTPRITAGRTYTPEDVALLANSIAVASAVVCAAGSPDASSTDEAALTAANTTSAALVAEASRAAGCKRLIHVSSAAVQGTRRQLDESEDVDGFSAYARSKIAGEAAVRRFGPDSTVVYRPPGVHGENRAVTRLITRIAASPMALVAAPGCANSPQSLATNVGDAIAVLATTEAEVPGVVIHPSEGITTRTLLEFLGGKSPRSIPIPIARSLTSAGTFAGRRLSPVAANARRLEMILFGQDQADSWLTENGWTPPDGPDAWRRLGETMRSDS